MRILITFRNQIQSHKIGWYKALINLGHNPVFWDEQSKPTFDIFDEFNPEILICHPDHFTKSVIKCIQERPNLVIISETEIFNEKLDHIQPQDAHILATDNHKKNLKLVGSFNNRVILTSKYSLEDTLVTHKDWANNGFKVVSVPFGFDSITYSDRGKYHKHLSCHFSYVGGYYPAKANKLNFLFELYEQRKHKSNIKIFGETPWMLPCYCGRIADDMLMDLFVSSSMNINILQPHAIYGFEINERIFKILGAGKIPSTEMSGGIRFLLGDYLPEQRITLEDIDNCISPTILPEDIHKDFLEKHSYIARMQNLLCQIDN